jgi:uncharacterized protein DUF4062
MADGALRVFLSHTSELRKYPSHVSYVAAAEEAVTNIGWVPIDMKYFPASDRVPAQECIESVSKADIFVGIIGFRYGSLVSAEDAVSHRAGVPRGLGTQDPTTDFPGGRSADPRRQ